jgi:shikimate kinase
MLILIGMSGVGKSTVGKVLAERLSWEFVDSDDLLKAAAGQPVPELLLQGEDVFLAKENETLLSTEFAPDTVLATGGSVIYLDAAMERLKQSGKCVYLASSFAAIERRVDFSHRGIVKRGCATMQEVFLERESLYQTWADVTVCVEEKTVVDSVAEIIAWLSGHYRGDIKK